MSSRWYLLLLSMFRCWYGRCLLLSHPSYLVVLLPPPWCYPWYLFLGECELWYSVHSRIARQNSSIQSMILSWSWSSLPSLSRSVVVYIGIASAIFELSTGSLMSWSFLIWSLGCISWCPLLLSLWWSCIFLRSLFVVCRRRFPPLSSFRHQGSC